MSALEIAWLAFEPEDANDLEVVCDGFGLRCCRVDIRRLKSVFLDTCLECAAREKSDRIELPEGTFDSAQALYEFFGYFALNTVTGSHDNNDLALPLWVHRANRLDLLTNDWGKDLLRQLEAVGHKLPALEQCTLGKRYHRPEMLKQGALRLLDDLPKDLSLVPFEVFVHWVPLLKAGVGVRGLITARPNYDLFSVEQIKKCSGLV